LDDARRLAEWASDGQLDDTGAEFLYAMGVQWLALESILNAHHFGAQPGRWCTRSDSVGAVASCLHDLARGVRNDAGWLKYLPDISNTCLLALAPAARMGMPHAVFAKRLTVAVELLQKITEPQQLRGQARLDVKVNSNRSVLLGKRGDQPVVHCKKKDVLNNTRYDVVKALLDAGDTGLTKDKLKEKSGHEDALGILRRLANSDPDWGRVIQFPGSSYGGYRIK
jgi:hypothetical protein